MQGGEVVELVAGAEAGIEHVDASDIVACELDPQSAHSCVLHCCREIKRRISVRFLNGICDNRWPGADPIDPGRKREPVVPEMQHGADGSLVLGLSRDVIHRIRKGCGGGIMRQVCWISIFVMRGLEGDVSEHVDDGGYFHLRLHIESEDVRMAHILELIQQAVAPGTFYCAGCELHNVTGVCKKCIHFQESAAGQLVHPAKFHGMNLLRSEVRIAVPACGNGKQLPDRGHAEAFSVKRFQCELAAGARIDGSNPWIERRAILAVWGIHIIDAGYFGGACGGRLFGSLAIGCVGHAVSVGVVIFGAEEERSAVPLEAEVIDSHTGGQREFRCDSPRVLQERAVVIVIIHTRLIDIRLCSGVLQKLVVERVPGG